MKQILFSSLLLASIGQFAQTSPNEIYKTLSASLLCKSLGFVDEAIENSNISIDLSKNLATDNDNLKSKSFTCKGLIYEGMQFSHSAAKDALNQAVKGYAQTPGNEFSFDSHIALKTLSSLSSKDNEMNVICETGSSSKNEPELEVIVSETGAGSGADVLKGQTDHASKVFTASESTRIDSLACTGNTHLNNAELDAAEKCFKAYLKLSYTEKNAERKNKAAVLQAIEAMYKRKTNEKNFLALLAANYKNEANGALTIDEIVSYDKYANSYVTNLYLAKEILNTVKDKELFEKHLEECLKIETITTEAKARIYVLKGILANEKKQDAIAIQNFKMAKSIFLKNKISTSEIKYLNEALVYLYKKTGQLKKVFVPETDVNTKETFSSLKYKGVADLYADDEVYAGIEIGSSGVKMTTISVKKYENPDRYEYAEVYDPVSRELNVSSFEGQSNRLVVQYVKEFVDQITKDYKIPKERILIAFSSGVNDAAQTKNKVKDLEEVRDVLSNEVGIEAEILTISQEAKYTHLGVLPQSRRLDITSIDIGGQNTKGGYFYGAKTNYKWGAFTFEYGTKSILEKASDYGRTKFDNLNVCDTKVSEIMESQSQYLKEEISDIMKEDERVLFAGGIAWVIARTLRPAKIGRGDFVDDITASDVRIFKNEIIKKGLGGFMEQQLRTVNNLTPAEKQKIEEVYEDIKSKKFTDERCIAGAVIVEGMMKQLDAGRKIPHSYSFGVHTIVGWITGKVVACSEGNCR
jgi:hypothetical protein